MIDLARIDPQIDDLLDGLQPLAAELGVAATLEIVRHFGGTQLYVPQRWTPQSDLNALGDETAQRLCALFGPERIDVPLMPFNLPALSRYVERLRADGLNNARVARSLGLSWRTVTRLAGGAPRPAKRKGRARDPRQIDIEEMILTRGA